MIHTTKGDPMPVVRSTRNSIFLVLALAIATSATAGQPSAEAQAAADRYLKAVPMQKMMEDTYQEMAKQVPAEKRAQFISDMRSVIKTDRLQSIARDAMLKTFSADEMNAMADFFASKHGASAMAKYGAYMGQVMPAVMQEVQQGVQQLQARNKK